MDDILARAIQSVQNSQLAYCKFLAPNDTKATESNQSGYLLGRTSWTMFFNKEPKKGEDLKSSVTIKWQGDFQTSSVITYYSSKNELRLTRFGRNFPFREIDNSGDLFIIAKVQDNCFEAFLLSHDEDIEEFFICFGIAPNETNKLIENNGGALSKGKLLQCFMAFIRTLKVDFPTTIELANEARHCYINSYGVEERQILDNPDQMLLNWLNVEYLLFKTIEDDRYSVGIKKGFNSVHEFLQLANSLLQRRKSRAGKSLELHLSEVFNVFKVKYEIQGKTEEYKKPDFLFPNNKSYQDLKFDKKRLVFLASKTTCKDRWTQILSEADRIKVKHLFTLQQGISKNQLTKMYKYNVRLVVPEPHLHTYPAEFQSRILSLNTFISFVKEKQK